MAQQAMTLATEPAVTPDQLELVKHTVAAGATTDELRLYLYDCQRQGVHPLDRLLHFTKRGGRYTPVTSIDLMRMRAAESGEYAGNDEYEFTGTPGRPGFKATARVWRLVHEQRVPFTRPARWEEYCPPAGQDHMWRRMPHVMLGKCAEAQALRAGFPRQLHGLYAAEELQQADAPPPKPVPPRAKSLEQAAREALETIQDLDQHEKAALVNLAATDKLSDDDNLSADDTVPDGYVTIERVDSSPTKNPKVIRFVITTSTGEQAATINSLKASLAEQYRDQRTPVILTVKQTKFGADLVKLETAADRARQPELPPTEDEIPF